MKNLKIIGIIGLFLFLSISCEKSKDTKPDDKNIEYIEIELNQKEKSLIQSSNQFGFDFFEKLNNLEEEDKNLFISPLSISLALAMTYNGAEGETKTAMEETLKLNGLTTDEINSSFQNLINALITVDPKILLNIANSIWYNNKYTVEQDFIDVNKKYYDAEVSPLDFSDPASLDIINNWVAEKTNDLIQNIIDNIPADAYMYLINTIYFKGMWKHEFDKENTSDYPFNFIDGTSGLIPMMVQKETLKYVKQDVFSAVDLPYGCNNFSMFIMLPNTGYTTNDVIDNLNETNWNSWLSELTETENIQVYLPKFKFEYKYTCDASCPLKNVLALMGMGIAFSPDADFSGMNPNLALYISRVIHQSFIEVNEEGTEAAAATVVEVCNTSSGENENATYFRINKPFVFAIREKSTNAILFMGKVVKPVNE
ncbi:MAG: serpin family protein [Bacteroidales bacterium]|nr:serpin family protein [Bacteroidales bacterium]